MSITWVSPEQRAKIEECFPPGSCIRIAKTPPKTDRTDVGLDVYWHSELMDPLKDQSFRVEKVNVQLAEDVGDSAAKFGLLIWGKAEDPDLSQSRLAMRLEWFDDQRLNEILNPEKRKLSVDRVRKEYCDGWHILPGGARTSPTSDECPWFRVFIHDGEPRALESHQTEGICSGVVESWNLNNVPLTTNQEAYLGMCEQLWRTSVLKILEDDIPDKPSVSQKNDISVSGAGWAAIGLGLVGLAAAKKFVKPQQTDSGLHIPPETKTEEKRVLVVEEATVKA